VCRPEIRIGPKRLLLMEGDERGVRLAHKNLPDDIYAVVFEDVSLNVTVQFPYCGSAQQLIP
jgi:hypothetical protein